MNKRNKLALIIFVGLVVAIILSYIASLISAPKLEPYKGFNKDIENAELLLDDSVLEIEHNLRAKGIDADVNLVKYNDAIVVEIHLPSIVNIDETDSSLEAAQMLFEIGTVLDGNHVDVVIQIYDINGNLVYQAD